MDIVSSPSNSRFPSTVSETAKQPTYTTVGSVYNPHATTPLQPPTRRPRTRRFQSPLDEPFQFPNALLSALPASGLSATERTPDLESRAVDSVPQYSPLKQNDDRAVSPMTEQEKAIFASLRMPIPTIRSGNLPPPSGPALGLGISDKQSNTVVGDSDSAASEDTLASSHFTVKGLTNLASYPNPMQRAAQKTLARARAANVAAFSRVNNTPNTLPSNNIGCVPPHFGRDRVTGTASTATGTPQPLTAGPPGQRQFRPSTFDAAIRALSLDPENSPLESSASNLGFQPNSDTISTYSHPFTGEDSGPFGSVRRWALDAQTVFLNPHASASRGTSSPAFSNSYSRPVTMAPVANPEDKEKRAIHDTLPADRIRQYFPKELPPDYSGRHCPVADNWYEMYPLSEKKFPQTSPEAISERQRKINRAFYAGTEGLTKNTDRVARDHDNCCLKNKIGVIGEGRERFKTSSAEKKGYDGKPNLPHLSVEDAVRMDHRLHAEPLLNMAFATLLKYKEPTSADLTGLTPHSNFMEVDPAWVDDSEEGNCSFFDKPKPEQPRRKRMVKRARRGY
ncbi:hypothetical protein B0T25DRAFT_596974 [Lasiosphaeria hispida]|uniref:Uncharacterized protein n=1 Tax=Lasiosphaeria hispida TaxID=260671 RepID=A0AAJ0HVG3_9PEZI|nr:hypothetical protein B0T25DRAFT_596974 [Lasiosphaeria hispida]